MEKTSTELKDDYLMYCKNAALPPTIEGFAEWLLDSHCIASHESVRKCIRLSWSNILKSRLISRQKGFGQITIIAMLFGRDIFKNLNARLKCSTSS